jgi:hypothetical protein
MPRNNPWPALLVIALLVLAVLACSIDISTAHFENAKLYKSPDAESSTRSFGPQDTIFCIVDLKDVEGTLPVRVVWNQVEESAEDGAIITTQLGYDEFESPNALLVVELPPPEEGWSKGNYTVDLVLDGDKKETLNFTVK